MSLQNVQAITGSYTFVCLFETKLSLDTDNCDIIWILCNIIFYIGWKSLVVFKPFRC